MKNIFKLIFYLFNLGYYAIEAMNADLVCPALLNPGDNLKCSLTLVNSKISNLRATFSDGVKNLNMTPIFVNNLERLGSNGRYFMFNSEITTSGYIMGLEIFSERDTEIYFNIMKMSNCNNYGVLDCWSKIQADPNFQMKYYSSSGWKSIWIPKGYSKLSKYFYNTQYLYFGQIPVIVENRNINLINNFKNTFKSDYHCYNSYGNYRCSYTTSRFMFYARLLVSYRSVEYPFVEVDFQKSLNLCTNLQSIASIFQYSQANTLSIVKDHAISVGNSICPPIAVATTVAPSGSNTFSSMTSTEVIQLLNTVDYDVTGCLVNCSNHGICQLNSDTLRYGCVCDEYYQGDSCQKDMRPCSNKGQCLNNATCNNIMQYDSNGQVFDYQCECVEPYEGRRCESIIDVCKNETCSNNGYCLNRNQTAICKCFLDYEGEFCERFTSKLKSIRNAVQATSILAIFILSMFYLSCILMDIHTFVWERKRTLPQVKRRPVILKFQYKN